MTVATRPRNRELVRSKHVLVVGAGGIGCELLKNLVLSGFRDIEIIDLDTIDVSNLNRQFLFREHHVGQPKSVVARESVLEFVPAGEDVKIVAHHGNIKDGDRFGSAFFGGFDLVMNALDNISARKHVNRMCLSTGVPLVESGTAGYVGQVYPIIKLKTECYECTPKDEKQKTIPFCTLHHTPTSPVHCMKWAQDVLFERLFGRERSPSVSPLDRESALQLSAADAGDAFSRWSITDLQLFLGAHQVPVSNTFWRSEYLKRVDEMQRGENCAAGDAVDEVDAKAVFAKLFSTDVSFIAETFRMKFDERSVPRPLLLETLPKESESAAAGTSGKVLLEDQRVWSVEESAKHFLRSFDALAQRFTKLREENAAGVLCFDKDDEDTLDFVVAASNLRAHCFHIKLLSKFDIKEMAGNIIPAIATTNAIVAGLLVIEALRILRDEDVSQMRLTMCRRIPGRFRRKPALLLPCQLTGPRDNCFVCNSNALTVAVDTSNTTLSRFIDAVVRGQLALNEPSVYNGDSILYESGEDVDPADFEGVLGKTLSELSIADGSVITVDELTQDVEWAVNIVHKNCLELFKARQSDDDAAGNEPTEADLVDAPLLFEIIGEVHKKESASAPASDAATSAGDAPATAAAADDDDDDIIEMSNGPESNEVGQADDSDDDLVIVDDEASVAPAKRPAENDIDGPGPKRARAAAE